jgi:predicted HTH domain antitoxin
MIIKMKQINLRLTEAEFLVVEQIAKILNQSVPSLLKELSLKELSHIRKKIALDLYSQKKVGYKRAWKISGLSFYEFQQAVISAGIEPNIPEEVVDEMVNLSLILRKEDIFPEGIFREKSLDEKRNSINDD